jgi:flagellar assembly factor FliW
MIHNYIYPSTLETQSYGQLLCNVLTKNYRPIKGATITIKEFTPLEKIICKITTNKLGKTKIVNLQAPPVEYSLEPNNPKPYSEYILSIKAPGYKPVQIKGIQILSTQLALQNVYMNLEEEKIIHIDPHTFYAEYPPKIQESSVKEFAEEPGYISLSRVVIPEIIVVHDGTPKNTTVNNYYVNYKDYIKNVVSSEIYATWPKSAIEANVLATLSFTLNRFYTAWYRKKGENYTITSSTAYDLKWSYARNIYQNISDIVDSLFMNYISKPHLKQPLFTPCCDGVRVQLSNHLMQWGSTNMASQGVQAIDILKHYFNQDVYINTSTKVSGVPALDLQQKLLGKNSQSN